MHQKVIPVAVKFKWEMKMECNGPDLYLLQETLHLYSLFAAPYAISFQVLEPTSLRAWSPHIVLHQTSLLL